MGNCMTPEGPRTNVPTANERFEIEKRKSLNVASEKKRSSSSKKSKKKSSSSKAKKAKKVEVVIEADLQRPTSTVRTVYATPHSEIQTRESRKGSLENGITQNATPYTKANQTQRTSFVGSPDQARSRGSFGENNPRSSRIVSAAESRIVQQMEGNEETHQITFKNDDTAATKGPQYIGASKMKNAVNASILNRLLKEAQANGYGVAQGEMQVSNQADRPPGCFIVPDNPSTHQVFFNENSQGVDDGLRRRKSLVELEAANVELRKSSVREDELARQQREENARAEQAEALRLQDEQRAEEARRFALAEHDRLEAQKAADEAFRVADAENEARRIAMKEELERNDRARRQEELAVEHARATRVRGDSLNVVDVTPVAQNSRSKRQSRSRVFKDQSKEYKVLYQSRSTVPATQVESTPRTSTIGSSNVVYNNTSQGVQNRVVEHATRSSYDLPLASPSAGVSVSRTVDTSYQPEATTMRSSRGENNPRGSRIVSAAESRIVQQMEGSPTPKETIISGGSSRNLGVTQASVNVRRSRADREHPVVDDEE